MGQMFSSLLTRLWGSKEVRILILGLDGKYFINTEEYY